LAANFLGQVGTDFEFAGLGAFLDGDTTDMLLRNSKTGGFELYDISNNNITNAAFLGNVGLDWQVMGFGNFSSFGETDMMLRNVKTGGLEVYDIRSNQITNAAFTGTVALPSIRRAPKAQPLSLCKPWLVSAPAAAQPTVRVLG
jgi:hypothetical protein